MTKMQIKKKVYEAYCNHGVATACDEANKHNQVKYEYCKACENDMPAIDHECLICGQETKPRNQTKELFTQGDFEIRTDHSRDAGNYPRTLIAANGRLIAKCYEKGWVTDKEEAEANTLLFAQAKNMYYALKDVYEMLNVGQPLGNDDLDQIYSILQKCTNEQSL